MPALTTIERVRLLGSEFDAVPDERLEMCIEDASLEVSSLTVNEMYHEKLARYLAAHFASLTLTTAKTVIREKLDVIERQYSDPSKNTGLDGSKYGQEYQRMLEDIEELEAAKAPKKGLNLVVI